jgi:glycosyltransferase involved in cell wall biosynthesis
MPVTVIIPNFNNEKFIRQSIISVCYDASVESIVVYDNNSSDESIGVIESIACSKVRIMRGTSNLGAARARHQVAMTCETDYIFFLDGDDFLSRGTVTAGYEAAIAQSLDLAIPEMVRTDIKGDFLSSFVPRPSHIINGREAFLMTVGGWKIHPMGVMRLRTYMEASKDFSFHGFSDDELLTRHLLLAADRIGGCDGTYNYRVVNKEVTDARTFGQITTDLRVLALASRLGFHEQEAQLRKQRNGFARALFGLWRRALVGRADMATVRSLLADFDRIDLPWRPADTAYHLAMVTVRATGGKSARVSDNG